MKIVKKADFFNIMSKAKIITLLLILFMCYFTLKIAVMKFINTDVCLDSGLCAENLEINTEYGLIKINKENCLKYNWKWDEKKKHCNLN